MKFIPTNILINKNLINKILEYSDKKINTNPPLLYSTLNPETNSDSPSEKSNGVRFNSAINLNKNNKANGHIKYNNLLNSWYLYNKFKFKESINVKGLIIIIDNLTSYEIDWAKERKDPNNEYLEFEDHPDINKP